MSYQRYSQTFQTTNATQQTAISIPVPTNSTADIQVDFNVTKSDFTNAAYGIARSVFRRGVGNVTRATGNGGLLGIIFELIGDFTTTPKVDVVANTSTQAADVKFTGIAATTLNWEFSVIVKRNA